MQTTFLMCSTFSDPYTLVFMFNKVETLTSVSFQLISISTPRGNVSKHLFPMYTVLPDLESAHSYSAL